MDQIKLNILHGNEDIMELKSCNNYIPIYKVEIWSSKSLVTEGLLETSRQGASQLGEANSPWMAMHLSRTNHSTVAPALGLHSSVMVALGNWWLCPVRWPTISGSPFEKGTKSPILIDSSKEHNLLSLTVISQNFLLDLLVWITNVPFVIKMNT